MMKNSKFSDSMLGSLVLLAVATMHFRQNIGALGVLLGGLGFIVSEMQREEKNNFRLGGGVFMAFGGFLIFLQEEILGGLSLIIGGFSLLMLGLNLREIVHTLNLGDRR